MISETLMTPRERGLLAFAADRPMIDNPYRRNDAEYWLWHDAWKEAWWKNLEEKPKAEVACISKI